MTSATVKRLWTVAFLLALALPATARAADDAMEDSQRQDPREQAERWDLVRESVYGNRPVTDAGDALQIEAPDFWRASAMVPVAVRMDPAKHIVALALFVDSNPSPEVGIFHFGPAIATTELKFFVRVNTLSLVHAVAETADGSLISTVRYVKAQGGCATPSTGQMKEIIARLGQIQLRRERPATGSEVVSRLLINHPNYNGMQMSGASTTLIPARYLEKISVSTGGVTVFDLDSSISLSEDPSISFTYTPVNDGVVDVMARDSIGTVFNRRFAALAQ
jgi:sulfur-oxidizing protein SoxY